MFHAQLGERVCLCKLGVGGGCSNVSNNNGRFSSVVFHQQGLAHCTLQDLQKLIHKNLKSSILSYSLHATPTQTGAHRWNVMWGMGGGGGNSVCVCDDRT